MELKMFHTVEEQAQEGAKLIEEILSQKDQPLLCAASGSSVKELYEEWVKIHDATKQFWFVSLDEWSGMNGDDKGSCRYFMDRDLLQPIHQPAERIAFFDGRTEAEETMSEVKAFIDKHGPIELCILGIGTNGHIGMNEPGTDPGLSIHKSTLHSSTITSGQKYFDNPTPLSTGITIGIADIMAAKSILLMINGKHKADIVAKLLRADPSADLPASFLKTHPSCHVYLDRDAASLISDEN